MNDVANVPEPCERRRAEDIVISLADGLGGVGSGVKSHI
jgi:hypothetical protein